MKRVGYFSTARLYPSVVMAPYVNVQAAGGQVAESFFIATQPCEVVNASESHTAAEVAAGSLAIDIVKEATGAAPGTSTTSVLAATFDGKGTANTPQKKACSATLASRQLAAGDRLSYKPAAVGTQLTGVIITVELKYI